MILESVPAVRPDTRPAVARRPCLGQGIQHAVGKLRRGEHLVVGKVGDAGEHVGVAPTQGKGGLPVHGCTPGTKRNGSMCSIRRQAVSMVMDA